MSAVADRLLGHVVVVVAAALVLLALAAPGSLGRPATCGNQVLERGETCDDGNLLPGDGCSERCRLEAVEDGQ
jgi:cysteine-rich repeat protein